MRVAISEHHHVDGVILSRGRLQLVNDPWLLFFPLGNSLSFWVNFRDQVEKS